MRKPAGWDEYEDISAAFGGLSVWPVKNSETSPVGDRLFNATIMCQQNQFLRARVHSVPASLHTFRSHSLSNSARCSTTALRIRESSFADGSFLPHLRFEYQFIIRAKEKVHSDLPLAATPRVTMRRQMVRGVEPEIQAFQDNDIYLSHSPLDCTVPPEYEYTSYRTYWQTIAIDRCPVL